MSRTDARRIYSRTIVAGDGCWVFCGGTSDSGYGIVSVGGRSVGVHVLSYRLSNGDVPKGMCVLHTCDVRRCINPDHLFLGTKGSNNTDRKNKGRNADRRGEKNTQARLRQWQVRAIRSLYSAGGLSQRKLAKRFGVSQQHVSAIVRGTFWKGSAT